MFKIYLGTTCRFVVFFSPPQMYTNHGTSAINKHQITNRVIHITTRGLLLIHEIIQQYTWCFQPANLRQMAGKVPGSARLGKSQFYYQISREYCQTASRFSWIRNRLGQVSAADWTFRNETHRENLNRTENKVIITWDFGPLNWIYWANRFGNCPDGDFIAVFPQLAELFTFL